MAVLKKFRPRWWLNGRQSSEIDGRNNIALVPPVNAHYDVRPLTVSQIDECWRLDQRCFVDGEAYSRDTFEYLLTAPESVSYRVVMQNGVMAGAHKTALLGASVPPAPAPATLDECIASVERFLTVAFGVKYAE